MALQRRITIIVEKHGDGYVAYPSEISGVVVGEGDTYENAIANVKSAIQFHFETFGLDPSRRQYPEVNADTK